MSVSNFVVNMFYMPLAASNHRMLKAKYFVTFTGSRCSRVGALLNGSLAILWKRVSFSFNEDQKVHWTLYDSIKSQANTFMRTRYRSMQDTIWEFCSMLDNCFIHYSDVYARNMKRYCHSVNLFSMLRSRFNDKWRWQAGRAKKTSNTEYKVFVNFH